MAAGARDVRKLAEIPATDAQRVLGLRLDVNQGPQVAAAVKQTIERFGRIDVLINNAGYGSIGAVEETPEAELRAQMETNFFGAVAMIRAALPAMRGQRAGAIVNISSMGGQMSFAGAGAYSASKFALEGISEALALELKPYGIKVLIVEPGAFRTGFAGPALKMMAAMEAYSETVGKVREFMGAMDNTQEGDPRKAAEAVERALASADTPLRLQLGGDAIGAVRAHAQQLLSDLEKWEKVGLGTKLG